MRVAAMLFALALGAVPVAAQEDNSLQEKAEKLLERVQKRPERAWDHAYSLRSLSKAEGGDKLNAVFEKGLDSESEHVRLVCAHLLVIAGSPDVALETVAELLESTDAAVVEAAARILAAEGPDDEEVLGKLREAWENAGDRTAPVRTALAEALYACTQDSLALEQLKEFAAGSDHELVARSSVALAELGQGAVVEGRLDSLSREPGELGRLARISREVVRIDRAVEEHKAGTHDTLDRLVAAEVRLVKQHYVDEFLVYAEKPQALTNENLVDNACRAMSTAVDRYGAFMTRAEIDEMNQDQEGNYVGIGAHVLQDENGFIYISQPIYEGPAYAAGIRTGDRLVGVQGPDGKRIDLTKLALEDGVKHVRGPEGSTAVVFVKRRGVEKELVFEIKRRMVHVDTALEEMLPGKVGYLRLTRFGANSGTDVKESLASLRRQGMETLVFDLRGNGGGQLSAVIDIADALLPKGRIISSTRGRFGDWAGTQPPFRSKGGDFTDIPMVVLVDGESASGSEMLSGALKDNNRAVVIGRTTFGKGIGQSFFNVEKTQGQRVLKGTVFSYLLPSGISIDAWEGQGGVTPHIFIEQELLEPWQVYAIDKLRKSQKLEEYLDQNYRGEAKQRFMGLAAFDALDPAAWPGFEAFYTGLATPLARDDVRRELRFALRSRVQDDRGAEFTQNYQEDQGLLRGVREVFSKTSRNFKDVPEYAKVIKE
ncbi:MAG: PDZ domain-containing protein [Planctomycetes bacterium]|nr:PDZ domain-containing protein [Planctomycetota bacterium]